jgi:YesN/AraC family two-component response regulator
MITKSCVYGLRSLLETQAGWTVVGEAADGGAAIEGVLTIEPDVALLDISMPVVDGLTGAENFGQWITHQISHPIHF